MENKTAIEMLIDIIKEKRKESDISNTLLRFCQVEAEKLLPKEREQKDDNAVNFAKWIRCNCTQSKNALKWFYKGCWYEENELLGIYKTNI